MGALVRLLGNFEVAEEIVQNALLVALERWPVEGIPERPGAWLLTVTRHRAIDQLRHDARYRDTLVLLEQPVVPEPDDRLRLMFTCCHPALSREAQVILTLRAVCGFTTAQIAHTFLANQCHPFIVPEENLVRMQTKCLIVSLQSLFRSSQFSAEGMLLLLADQDRSRWKQEMITDAVKLIEQAAALGHPGPYPIQAALMACHAEAESWQATNWPQILALYDDSLASHSAQQGCRLAICGRASSGPERG